MTALKYERSIVDSSVNSEEEARGLLIESHQRLRAYLQYRLALERGLPRWKRCIAKLLGLI